MVSTFYVEHYDDMFDNRKGRPGAMTIVHTLGCYHPTPACPQCNGTGKALREEDKRGQYPGCTKFGCSCREQANDCKHCSGSGHVACEHLLVVGPNGQVWDIDSRASNCTLRNDNEHRCWVRHGDPKTGKVTVDKNGRTCSAGAGSIILSHGSFSYHGFLQGGVFTHNL